MSSPYVALCPLFRRVLYWEPYELQSATKESFLQKLKDPNLPGAAGRTPLAAAAQSGHAEAEGLFVRVFLWALVVDLFDSSGVCSMGRLGAHTRGPYKWNVLGLFEGCWVVLV